MPKCKYEWEDNWGLRFDDGPNHIELTESETIELIKTALDAFCPFCFQEIPAESKVCCDCLLRVYTYHQNQHACIR